jgi:hypothetical protein
MSSVHDEPDAQQRIARIHIHVQDAASRILLQLADIARVEEEVKAITDRLGNIAGSCQSADQTQPDAGTERS